ncbi:hypothetical protein KKH13_03940 [Patescibacteria group bacterium]|nr:hypothetical protein [Patescibacteria group bacterium]
MDKQRLRVVLALNDGLLAEEIDPMSLTTEKLLKADRSQQVRWHSKQTIEPIADVIIKNPLVIRAKLDRYDVVNGFLNQRAEGRVGQEEPPKPGEDQLPGQVNWLEGQKQMIIAGLPYSGDPNHLTVVEVLEVLEDTERMVKENQTQIKGQIQGRSGWIAEAILRRMEEVWKETADIYQKDTKELLTWTAELGRGHLVAEWLEIPDVARVLAQKDLYKQRDPVTDKPKEIESLPKIEARLKQWAKDNQIPMAKVDLAIYIAQLLQIGYWTGRVGWKTRHSTEKYSWYELGAGLPLWLWGDPAFKSVEDEIGVLDEDEKRAFEFQLVALNALTMGFMTSYTTEHLGRIPNNASEEDLLFISEVGEPAIYEIPDDNVIKAISNVQMIDFDELKEQFQRSHLHREQYRWQFVYGWYSGLYKSLQRVAGEEAAERQYLNPTDQIHRNLLRRFLQLSNSPAATTLREAGINSEWITDEVIVQLFTDENMEVVNSLRQNRGGKIKPSDLVNDVRELEGLPLGNRDRIRGLAMALEIVLRDKKTWGVDLGENNIKLVNGQLSREIRARGGFGADEMGLMVTLEYLRKEIAKTLAEYQDITSKMHLHNEFYTAKDAIERLTKAYGDNVRFRASSLVSPFIALETSISIRASMMLVGYWDAKYAHTGGRMVTDQEALYDQMDIDRIFHERFHPVVGASERIKDREAYLIRIGKIKGRQRGKISAALARFYEREFGKSPGLDRILTYVVGEGGKDTYRHCVPGRTADEFILADDKDYWLKREEREAQAFYYPASIMQVATWESQARQGQIDEDRAKQQIDQMVSFGFMRRWYNDKFIPVGLGDLFRVKFEIGKQTRPFPIDFMIDLGERVQGVAFAFAMANGYENPSMFWQHAKLGALPAGGPTEGQFAGHSWQDVWNGFREKMIKGWLVDPALKDSELPKTYWDWREMALSMMDLREESLDRVTREGIVGPYFRLVEWFGKGPERLIDFVLKDKKAEIRKIIGKDRGELIDNLAKDPIPEELGRIKELYGGWVLEEVTRDLMNAEKTGGLFLNEKVQIRKSIEDHYRHGKIDRNTRDLLMSRVIESQYKPNFLKSDWKDPNFWINNSWVSVPGAIWEVTSDLLETFKVEVKKYLWFEQGKAILNSSPAGYLTALIANPAWPTIIKTAIAIGEKTAIPALSIPVLNIAIPAFAIPISLGSIWNIFWLIQGPAIVYSNGWRFINWGTRKLNKLITGKAKGIADGDSLVTIKERVGS